MSLNKQTTQTGERISLGDLPRTAYKPAFGVQQALIAVFNYCRRYPTKMSSLKTLIMFVLGKIQEWEKLQDDIGSQVLPTLVVDPQRVRLGDKDGLLPHTMPDKVAVVSDFISKEPEAAQVQLTRVRTAPVTTVTELPQLAALPQVGELPTLAPLPQIPVE